MNRQEISSPSNQMIKELVRLKERRGDRARQFFLVEGAREIERAWSKDFFLHEIFVCPTLLSEKSLTFLSRLPNQRQIVLSKVAFSKVATRESTDGILAVFANKNFEFQDILCRADKDSPFIIVLENVEKPGNLGAILRSADGIGVHGVVLLGRKIDTWNPNVIRSSLGAVFSVPITYCDNYDVFFEWCELHKIQVIASVLSEKSSSIFDQPLTGPVAIALGEESTGLSSTFISRSHNSVMIPMNGVGDSLNVSVAAGILMYEALRQRHQGATINLS
jgi:RNA methyltransferase, TrmH family